MKVAIVGSGANGAPIGADLTRAGVDVVLLYQWLEHVEAMREHGLRINMPHETHRLSVRGSVRNFVFAEPPGSAQSM